MKSLSIAVGRVMGSGISGIIREPAEVLGEKRTETMGVDTGVNAKRSEVARFINGYDTTETFFNTPNSINIEDMVKRGNITSGRSYFPCTIKITRGQGGAFGSTVTYTSPSTSQDTLDSTGGSARIS